MEEQIIKSHGTIDDFNKKYKLIEKIGEGKQSQVFLYENIKTGQKVVVKKIKYKEPIIKFKPNLGHSEKYINDMAAIENMILIYKKLSANNECHKYVECFIESFVNIGENEYIIVTDYIQGFSLEKREIDKNEYCILKMIKDILEALKYIHDYGVSHNDLHFGNVMYDEIQKRYRLVDFGFSCGCNNLFTNVYIASPESIDPFQKNQNKRFHRSDLWSLGILAYKKITGLYPWNSAPNFIIDTDFDKILNYIADKDINEIKKKKISEDINGEPVDYFIDKIPLPEEIDENKISLDLIDGEFKLVKVILKALLKRNWRERIDYNIALFIVDELLDKIEQQPEHCHTEKNNVEYIKKVSQKFTYL